MTIANTAQAEAWNSGEDVAHWVRNQARYDRMNEPTDDDGVHLGASVWLVQAATR